MRAAGVRAIERSCAVSSGKRGSEIQELVQVESMLLGHVVRAYQIGLDPSCRWLRVKFPETGSSLGPSDFREISRKPVLFFFRGSKSQVLSTSFWQGLHFSRCRGLIPDTGQV